MLKGPPDVWNRPAVDDIRSSMNTIVANPEKYPLSPGGWGDSRDFLTKEVANRLKSRSMETERECGTDKNAIYRVDLPECIIYAIRALYPKVTIDVTNFRRLMIDGLLVLLCCVGSLLFY